MKTHNKTESGARVLDLDAARSRGAQKGNTVLAEVEEPRPAGSDVIASIRIELHRGGRISKHIDGVNSGNARRLTASLMRALAEVFSVLDRKKP